MKKLLLLTALFIFCKAYSQDLAYFKWVDAVVESYGEFDKVGKYKLISEVKKSENPNDVLVETTKAYYNPAKKFAFVIVLEKTYGSEKYRNFYSIHYYHNDTLVFVEATYMERYFATYYKEGQAFRTDDHKTYRKVAGDFTLKQASELMEWFIKKPKQKRS